MRTSELINEIAAALAKAQKEMSSPSKDKKVNAGNMKYKYADLAAVIAAVTPALIANGIALVQTVIPENSHLLICTRLVHASGQWIESNYPITGDILKPQIVGSAMTYARRYSILAICNIFPEDEDDDGRAAQEHSSNGNGASDPDVRDMTGNPDAKHYKSNGTTAKAIEARGNNEFFAKCQAEIRQAQSPEALKEWATLRRTEIGQKLSPAAVETLQEVYENHKADLMARMPA